MDPYQIATIIVSLLFGGQGIASFIKARRSRQGTMPADEGEARQAAAPDWAGFNTYWKQEIAHLHKRISDMDRELSRVRLESAQRAAADAQHIDDLEEHIWLRKPPPPPSRKKAVQ